MWHDLRSQITFHMLPGLQKNQTAILKLTICLSAFFYLFHWKVEEGEREGGTVLFYECLPGSLIIYSHSIVQRTKVVTRWWRAQSLVTLGSDTNSRGLLSKANYITFQILRLLIHKMVLVGDSDGIGERGCKI